MRITRKPLVIKEFSSVARKNWPVTGGVPFEKGELESAGNLRIVDAGGSPVPVQSRVLCRWEDGSIRWAGLHIQVTVEPMETVRLTLEYGDEAAAGVPPAGITLEEDETRVAIKTRAMEIFLNPDPVSIDASLASGNGIIRAAAGDGFRVIARGKDFFARADRMRAEIRGPLYTLYRIDGSHRADDGDSLFDFALRLHFYADSPFFQADYTFINREDDRETAVDEILFQASAAPAAVGRALTGWCRNLYGSPGLEVILREPNFKTGFYPNAEVFGENGERAPAKSYGWIDLSGSSGGAAIGLRDYSEQYPKKTSALDGKLRMHFWPAEAGGLKFFQGMAKTHMMMVYPHAGSGADARVSETFQGFNERLVFVPQPWYLETKVFGDVFPCMPEKYPQIERRMRDEFIAWEDANRAMGMMDWGDFPQLEGEGREKFMANNEHDFMHAVLLQWMRAGERKYLRALDASVFHTLDIDTVHHDPLNPSRVGGVRAHNDNHWGGSLHYGGGQAVTPCHMWAEGLAEYYCLFADDRALEGARGICDYLVGLEESGKYQWGEGRIPGWACVSLIPTYEASGDARYLELAKKIIHRVIRKQEPDGSWRLPHYGFHSARCPFQSTIFATGMTYYLRAAPDEKIKDSLLKFCSWRARDGLMPDGSVYYVEAWDYYRSRYGGDLREPLGFAYSLSGDAVYIEHGMADHERCFSGSLRDRLNSWSVRINPRTNELVPVFGHVLAYNWRGNLRFMYWAEKAGKLRDLPSL